MLTEQQKRILQILYQRRSDSLHTFDRDGLVRAMGKHWSEIQHDVADLEQQDYLITTHDKMGTRLFHRLSITPEGVNCIKRDMSYQPSIKVLDVFISSPGDVDEERRIARRVIERCNRLHSVKERYVLRSLAYEEHVPAAVGKGPQSIVDSYMKKASSADIFICVLWHRMGTPVIDEETGQQFQSGTEYEFIDAYNSNQLHGKPYILLYQGMKPFPEEVEQQQLDMVQNFFKRFEGRHAEFKGMYKKYSSNEDFEESLFHDVEAILAKNLLL